MKSNPYYTAAKARARRIGEMAAAIVAATQRAGCCTEGDLHEAGFTADELRQLGDDARIQARRSIDRTTVRIDTVKLDAAYARAVSP